MPAVPSTAIAADLDGVVEGKVVVDPTNPLASDLSRLLPADST